MFKFAGYEDLTLPCPVPCPVLPCPEQGRVKKEIFHPALLRAGQGAGQGRVTLPCGHLWSLMRSKNVLFLIFFRVSYEVI